MTKGFLARRAGIKRAAMGSNAKRWKDLFIYGWLAVISCVLTVLPRGLAIAQREPDFWHYFSGLSIFNALHWMMPNIELRSGTTCRSSLPVACRGWDYSPVHCTLAGKPQTFRNRLFVELDDNAAAVFSVAKGKLPTYILSCFAPLAILMAHYALLAAKKSSGVAD